MKKRLLLLLSSTMLVASCGNNAESTAHVTSSEESTSSSISSVISSEAQNTVKFYRNLDSMDSTILYVLERNEDGSVETPYVPVEKKYVFDGWYDQKSGGEAYQFTGVAPEALYAHWAIYADIPDAEKVSRYVNRIQEMCPKVSETRAYVETATQFSVAEGIYYSEDHFCAKRYSDIVTIDHYYPKVCYSEADLSENEKEAGKTVESVNADNLVLTEQDFMVDSSYYQIFDFNERHPQYVSENEDGKYVTKANPLYLDSYLSIDFAAYFMGWANQLSIFISRGGFEKVTDLEEGLGDNSYWISQLNVSSLDESKSSQAFGFAYTYSYYGNNDTLVTQLFQSTCDFALIDGKIRHCQVMKNYSYYINGEAMQVETSLSIFDFNAVDEYEEYQGERFDPNKYDTYED